MTPQPARNFRWKPWLFAGLAAAAGISIFAALRHTGAEVRARVTGADPAFLLLALGLCILYRIVNSCGWVFVLRSLGHPMPLARGARVWIIAESLRWLPGSVWGFCSRVYQAEKEGAPPAVAAASLPLELLLTIAAWAITAAVVALKFGLAFDWEALAGSPVTLALIGAVLVLLGVGVTVALHLPRHRLPKKAAGLLTQLGALAMTRPRIAPLAFTLLLYIALCALNGLAFFCILRSLTGAPLSVVTAIGANACGWLAGFFAVGVPGGIGVREASSAMVLSTLLPAETVVAGAVLWRFVLIADELCCLGVLLVPSAWKAHCRRIETCSPRLPDFPNPQP